MKTISGATKGFAATAVIATTGLLYFLFHSVNLENYNRVPYIAIGYGIVLFASGLFWGSKDSVRKTRYDIGFTYHLLTYVIANGIGLPMMVGMLGFDQTIQAVIISQIVMWGIGLLVHYYISKKTIKGMDPEEVFS